MWHDSCICVWYDSRIYVTQLIRMYAMTHAYVWHVSFIYVTRLIHVYVTWLIHLWNTTHSYVSRDSCIHVTRHIHICDTTHLCVCDMPYTFTWHDSSTCMTWLISMRAQQRNIWCGLSSSRYKFPTATSLLNWLYRTRNSLEGGFRLHKHSRVWFVPPTSIFVLDLYHNERAGSDICGFPVDGLDTQWIPKSFLCGKIAVLWNVETFLRADTVHVSSAASKISQKSAL